MIVSSVVPYFYFGPNKYLAGPERSLIVLPALNPYTRKEKNKLSLYIYIYRHIMYNYIHILCMYVYMYILHIYIYMYTTSPPAQVSARERAAAELADATRRGLGRPGGLWILYRDLL